MIVGYHITFGMYGFWLPNDPRGSWSDYVCSWELLRYGPATKTTERRSVASRSHSHSLRLAAKKGLRYPPVVLSGVQARAVGRGFDAYCQQSTCPVWACAILPNHVHLVTGQLNMDVEQLVIQLKAAATRALIKEELHPFADMKDDRGRVPKCFARGQWKVYLDPEDVPRAIKYVEDNPLKEGKPRQRWSFVISPKPEGG
jgi:REP-associated tyrosine transposase